jgi:hypothetical protein
MVYTLFHQQCEHAVSEVQNCNSSQEKVNPTANIYSQITSLVRLQLLTAVGGFSIYFLLNCFLASVLQIVFVSILCVFLFQAWNR